MRAQKGDVIAIYDSGWTGAKGRLGEIVRVEWFSPWPYVVRIDIRFGHDVKVRLREQDFKVIGDIR